MNIERVAMETQQCVLFIVQLGTFCNALHLLGYPQQADSISHEGSDSMENLCHRQK
jgi:hypothetical protein